MRPGLLSPGRLGFGAGSLGGSDTSEREVAELLEAALALGVVLFDTARSYGESEARLGRHLLARHRDRVLVSTKIGYGVDGVPDWTPGCITAGVERARAQLGVDVIDIVHLHSCPVSVLESGVVDALAAAQEAGKLRWAAYSGDGDGLAWAVDSGRFQAVQASFNLCDRANRPILERARTKGMTVLAKRSLANAPWRGSGTAAAAGAPEYDSRWAALGLSVHGLEPGALALRYAAFHGPVDTVLVGTRRRRHLASAVAALEAGPLRPEWLRVVEERWSALGASWPAII